MPLFRNMTGQGVYLFAHDSGGAKAGDSANITGSYSLDGTDHSGFATANPTEMGGGVYWQPLAQAETDANRLAYRWASSTSGVAVDPVFEATGVQLADDVAHGGPPGSSTATYAGKQINITSSSGDDPAVLFSSTGINPTLLVMNSNGDGVKFKSTGIGAGLWLIGASSGSGLQIDPGDTGTGVLISGGATYGDGIDIFVSNGSGISMTGSGDGNSALLIYGSGNANGATFQADSPGIAFSIPTGIDANMVAIMGDGLDGLNATLRLKAIHVNSRDSSIPSVLIENDSGGNACRMQTPDGGDVLVLQATYAGGGLKIITDSGNAITLAATSGDGIHIAPTTGNAITLSPQDGDGIHITTTAGNAITLAPVDGDGIHIAPTLSSNSAATGISVVGAGTGPAVQLGDGSSGAIGLRILSAPDGTALSIEGDATGMLINGRGGLVITGNDGAGAQIVGTDAPGILVEASLVVAPSMPAMVLAPDTGPGFDGTLSPATLASFFLVDTTKVYADAVSGSVVKEIASNAGGGGNPNVILSGTLGDQSLGDVDHIVLPSGPSDNGVLVGSRLRIISGAGQYQERTIIFWNGTDKIAGIDMPLIAVEQAPGDTFQVLYDHSYQLDPSGNVISIAEVSGFFDYALAQFVTLDTTKTASDIAAGSVVYLSRHSIAGIGF